MICTQFVQAQTSLPPCNTIRRTLNIESRRLSSLFNGLCLSPKTVSFKNIVLAYVLIVAINTFIIVNYVVCMPVLIFLG